MLGQDGHQVGGKSEQQQQQKWKERDAEEREEIRAHIMRNILLQQPATNPDHPPKPLPHPPQSHPQQQQQSKRLKTSAAGAVAKASE